MCVSFSSSTSRSCGRLNRLSAAVSHYELIVVDQSDAAYSDPREVEGASIRMHEAATLRDGRTAFPDRPSIEFASELEVLESVGAKVLIRNQARNARLRAVLDALR